MPEPEELIDRGKDGLRHLLLKWDPHNAKLLLDLYEDDPERTKFLLEQILKGGQKSVDTMELKK